MVLRNITSRELETELSLDSGFAGHVNPTSMIDALRVLSEHWGSASNLLNEVDVGNPYIMDDNAWATCSASIDNETEPTKFCLYPCTGGFVGWDGDTVYCHHKKSVTLTKMGITHFVRENPERLVISNVGSLIPNLRFRYDKSLYINKDDSEFSTEMREKYNLKLWIGDSIYLTNTLNLDRLMAKWLCVYNRVPKNPTIVKSVPFDLIEPLKPNFKWFLKLIEALKLPQHAHDVEAAALIAMQFGPRYHEWICLFGGNIHDAGISLPAKKINKEGIEYIFKHKKYSKLLDMVTAVSRIDALVNYGASYNMRPDILIAMSQAVKYNGVHNINLATECAKWHLQQEAFTVVQDTVKDKKVESMPYVDIVHEGMRFYKLATDDYRGLFLGNYTNCCQHVMSAGKTCAWHGQLRHDGAFYVIEDKGHIIAQSWAWRRGNVVVFDSIEVLQHAKENAILLMYKLAVETMLKGWSLGVCQFRAGGGSGIGRLFKNKAKPITTPKDVYTDASSQYIIEQKEGKLFEKFSFKDTIVDDDIYDEDDYIDNTLPLDM